MDCRNGLNNIIGLSEKTNPFISICIPTYNRKKYLGEAIRSAVNQSYKNFEIVVIDDGSTENINYIIDDFSSDKIRFIRKEHTNGPDTRNICISESKGEFILWLGDDDILDRDILKEYVDILNLYPGLDILYSFYRMYFEETKKEEILRYEDWYYNRSKLSENLLFHAQFMDGGGLFRKNIYNKIGGFNTKFIRAHDYEIAFRIAFDESIKLKLVPKPLYTYRQYDNGNLSGTMKQKDFRYDWAIIDRALSNQQLINSLHEDKRGIAQSAQIYFNLALRYSQLNCIPRTIEYLEKSLQLCPDNKVTSFLNETKTKYKNVIEKRITLINLLKKNPDNNGILSNLEIIDRIITPFDRQVYFPDDDHTIKDIIRNKPGESFKSIEPPLISIIIPCYNQAQYLEECVGSVINQSYTNWECLIVNDGSPDNTSNTARTLINNHPDKKISLLEIPNGGLSDARNFGISNAKGNYILPLDADDLICPTMLEASLKYMINNNCDVVYTDQQYFESDNRIVHVTEFNSELLLKQNYFAYCSLYKKAVWQKNNGYNKNMIWGYEDWDFWIGSYENGFIFGHLPDVLFKYRVKQNSMLSNALKHDVDLKCRIILNHPGLYDTSSAETAKKLIDKGSVESGKDIPLTPLKIVAIISAYNEGDIIYHVIGDLIKNDILVYLINNNSADNTYEQASRWLGKGLLHIENFPDDSGYPDRSKKEYVWGDILKRKEELSYKLNADWFIHADADEFRESPFPGTSLAEGIEIVDSLGFNAINFELYNFRPTDNSFKSGEDVRNYLKYLEYGQWFDRNQIKAWKKQIQQVDLTSSGGHIVKFPASKIFPVPFILRHYPIRSQAQGEKKVYKDRLPRFSKEEKAIGWHVQYDSIDKNNESFLSDPGKLIEYNERNIKAALLTKAVRSLVLTQIPYSKSISFTENFNQQKNDNLVILRYLIENYSEYALTGFAFEFLDLLKLLISAESLISDNLLGKQKEGNLTDKPNVPLISIIIPVFNKIEFTINCLESISKAYNQENSFEVIVVDNGSSDGTKEFLEFAEIIYPYLRVISNPVNIGFARANNKGVLEAAGKYVLFLNNDTVVQNGWIDNLISVAINDNSVGAVGCKLLFPDGSIQHAGVVILGDKTNPEVSLVANHVYYNSPANLPEANQLRTYQALTAACLLVRKSAFNEINGFDEEYWNGYEDVDLCFKLKQNGWKLVYQPLSVVFHYESKSGAERFSKVSENIERLNKKWNHSILPDFIIGKEGNIIDANTIQIREYISPVTWESKQKITGTNYQVSIIVLTYNGLKYNKEFIHSVDKHTRGNYEVIIVDNASTDGTIGFLKDLLKKHDNYKLILNKENLGFPKAVNQAIKISKGQHILIANNDIVVTKGWLGRLVAVAESDPLIGIVGPISNSVSGVQLDKNANYKNISELPAYAQKIRKQNTGILLEFPRVAFLCTLIKKEVIEKLGGLDERFSPGNFEDDDFCLRAQLFGYKTVIATDVFIHHYGSKSFTAQGIEKYAERLKINEAVFINKWGANPDDIWIRGKSINQRNCRFPLNINPFIEKYERALICIAEKEYEQALNNLNDAIDNFSYNSGRNISYDQLLNLGGNVALIINNSEAAKSYFEKELNFNSSSDSACKGLADIFFINQDFEAAKTMYEWAIKYNPENYKAITSLEEVNNILRVSIEEIVSR